MAMAGRDGGYSSCTVSSSTGTISTTYASTTGSRLSSIILDLEIHDGEYVSWEESEEGEMMKHIESLVLDLNLERWFSELGVGWVLHLPPWFLHLSPADDDDTSGARIWIRALAEIVRTNKLFGTNSAGLPRACEEEPEARRTPDQLQFAQFFQQAMLNMLAFVDFVAGIQVDATNGVLEGLYEKLLSILLGVRGALSKALQQMEWPYYSPASADVLRIQDDIVSLLAAKEGKTRDAIRRTIRQVFTRIMEKDGDDLLETQAPPESSGIHKDTRSVTRYIGFLLGKYSSVAPIVSAAARYGVYAPQNEGIPPLDSMVLEMASCLEEQLGRISQSFPNNSLGFLFLINNLYYLMEQFNANLMSSLSFSIPVFSRKIKNTIDNYIQTYLQVSWAPVLSCLYYSTPLCLGRSSSPAKFEAVFQKTYTAQKLWKVPDPKLRTRIRVAVIETVVPSFTKYLEYNNISPSRITPQDLMNMLQELFEG